MFKKAILIGAVVLALSPTLSLADGFYVGAGVGRDTADFDTKVTSTNTDPFGNSVSATAKENAAGTGFLGTVFGGYGWSYNWFYLGGEVNFTGSTLEYKNSSTDGYGDSVKDKYQINKSYGASLIPGIKLTNNTLLYGRVGYVDGDFGISTALAGVTGTPVSASDDKWLNGIRYGMGIETALNCNVDMRLEYNHISYQSYNASASNVTPFGSTTNKLRISPEADQVELGVVYKFA